MQHTDPSHDALKRLAQTATEQDARDALADTLAYARTDALRDALRPLLPQLLAEQHTPEQAQEIVAALRERVLPAVLLASIGAARNSGEVARAVFGTHEWTFRTLPDQPRRRVIAEAMATYEQLSPQGGGGGMRLGGSADVRMGLCIRARNSPANANDELQRVLDRHPAWDTPLFRQAVDDATKGQ